MRTYKTGNRGRGRTGPALLWAGLLFLALVSSRCSAPSPDPAGPGLLRIVTTTGLLEDAVRNIVGDRAEVVALMGPGVDPHLYKATQGDVRRLSRADIIVYNGLHLEGKMGEVLRKVSRHKTVIAAAEGLPKHRLRPLPGSPGNYDPHIWFDVLLWKDAVQHLSEELQKRDPANRELYARHTATYTQELDQLDAWVKQQLARIPAAQRVLVTAHDAFGYFGEAYGIEVRGLQGISTVAEFGLRDVSTLVGFMVERRLPAIFVESSVSQRSVEAVIQGSRSRGHPIRQGGTLYSDALGAKNSPAGTYTGMVRANVQTIVEGLLNMNE
ncbi:manganese ABC transporter substrate-binding protein/adhesin MntA [soil metagenome]